MSASTQAPAEGDELKDVALSPGGQTASSTSVAPEANPDELTEKDRDRINECVQWMRWSWQAKQFHRLRWLDRHRRYRRYKDDSDWGTARSRMYVPAEVFTKTRILQSNIMEAFFGTSNDFFGFSTKKTIKQPLIMAWEEVEKEWLRENKSTAALDRGFLQFALYGNCCFTFDYDAEKNMPETMWRDIFSVFPSPNARSVDDADFIIIRSIVPNQKLKAMRDAGVFGERSQTISDEDFAFEPDTKTPQKPGQRLAFTDDDLMGMPLEAEDNTYHYEALKRQDVGEDPATAWSRQTFSEVMEVYEDKRTTFLLNRKKVLYDAPNPHGVKPLVIVPMIPTDDSIWGEGIGDVCRDPEDSKLTLFNMQMDSAAIQTLPVHLIRKNAIKRSDYRIRPEGLIPVEDTMQRPLADIIQQLRVGDISQTAMQLTTTLNRNSDDATGVFPSIQGTSQAGVDSASEFVGLQKAANIGLKNYLRRLETYLIEPMLRWNIELTKAEYKADPKRVIAGIQLILGEDIDAQFIQSMLEENVAMDVKIKTGTRYVNNQMRQQQWIQLIPALAPILPTGVLNLPVILEDLFHSFDFDDADKLVFVNGPPGAQGAPGEQPQNLQTIGGPEKMAGVQAAPAQGAMAR